MSAVNSGSVKYILNMANADLNLLSLIVPVLKIRIKILKQSINNINLS